MDARARPFAIFRPIYELYRTVAVLHGRKLYTWEYTKQKTQVAFPFDYDLSFINKDVERLKAPTLGLVVISRVDISSKFQVSFFSSFTFHEVDLFSSSRCGFQSFVSRETS